MGKQSETCACACVTMHSGITTEKPTPANLDDSSSSRSRVSRAYPVSHSQSYTNDPDSEMFGESLHGFPNRQLPDWVSRSVHHVALIGMSCAEQFRELRLPRLINWDST